MNKLAISCVAFSLIMAVVMWVGWGEEERNARWHEEGRVTGVGDKNSSASSFMGGKVGEGVIPSEKISMQSLPAEKGFPGKPANRRQLNLLLANFSEKFRSDRKQFYFAIDEIYRGESRREVWARPLEVKAREVAESVPGLIVAKIDCRSSLCRVDVVRESTRDGSINIYIDRLKKSVQSTSQDIQIIGSVSAEDMRVVTLYFFSLNVPADYVDVIVDRFGLSFSGGQ